MTPARRLAGELLGTTFLLAAVVGSGIMGERLSGGNVAIALLANTLATGATLVTLIFTFRSMSGAHFGSVATRGPWFDIVTIYAEDPTGPVPTPPFPGSRDRLVRSMVLAVLPHFTGP